MQLITGINYNDSFLSNTGKMDTMKKNVNMTQMLLDRPKFSFFLSILGIWIIIITIIVGFVQF